MEQSEQADADLQLLLTTTGLLAACACGESLSIDAICQGIFTFDELLDLLCDCSICSAYKTPFLQFLTAVYLDCNDQQGKDITNE